MNKSVNAGRAINLILTKEDINIDSKSQLIQIKKILEYGENNWVDDDKDSNAKVLAIIEDVISK